MGVVFGAFGQKPLRCREVLLEDRDDTEACWALAGVRPDLAKTSEKEDSGALGGPMPDSRPPACRDSCCMGGESEGAEDRVLSTGPCGPWAGQKYDLKAFIIGRPRGRRHDRRGLKDGLGSDGLVTGEHIDIVSSASLLGELRHLCLLPSADTMALSHNLEPYVGVVWAERHACWC